MGQVSVRVQISETSLPSFPPWLAEVAAFAQVLTHEDILKAVQDQVRFARARFGTYDLIDFAVVLIGYIHAARTDLAGLLRTARSVGGRLYGAFWPHPLASSLDPVPVSRLGSIKARWKPYVHAFTRRSLPARRFLLPAAWLIGRASSG